MVKQPDLHEKDSVGDHFTWTNNQINGMRYSRIDRVLGNLDWRQQNMGTMLHIMNYGVSDHSFLCLQDQNLRAPSRTPIIFQNVLVNKVGFTNVVKQNWARSLVGYAIYIIWKKLQRLQPVIKDISKSYRGITRQLEKAREDLFSVQIKLL